MKTKSIVWERPQLIEGIGERGSAKLAAVGVHSLADLLTTNLHMLADAVDFADEAQLRKWRAAASFVLIEGLSPNLAEAFVADGIESMAELARSSLRRLEKAAANAREAGLMREEPDLYRLAALLRGRRSPA